jgi:hypothetical protein
MTRFSYSESGLEKIPSDFIFSKINITISPAAMLKIVRDLRNTSPIDLKGRIHSLTKTTLDAVLLFSLVKDKLPETYVIRNLRYSEVEIFDCPNILRELSQGDN